MEQKEWTESLTVRLPHKLIKELKDSATHNQISVSTLIQQVLNDYIEWGMTAIQARWMVISKDSMMKIIDELDEKTVERIGKEAATFKKDITLFMTRKDDLDGFLSVLRGRSKKSGFAVREDENRIIIQHDMGKKWSIYCKAMYDKILDELNIRHSITNTEHTIIIELPK
jgi:hypothetical protein